MLGSARSRGRLVVERLGIASYFDVIFEGYMVLATQPDPEGFTKADCVVKGTEELDRIDLAGLFQSDS